MQRQWKGRTVGERMHEIADELGLSQSELGEALGSSYQVVHSWIKKNGSKRPSHAFVVATAGMVGLRLEDVVTGASDETFYIRAASAAQRPEPTVEPTAEQIPSVVLEFLDSQREAPITKEERVFVTSYIASHGAQKGGFTVDDIAALVQQLRRIRVPVDEPSRATVEAEREKNDKALEGANIQKFRPPSDKTRKRG
jgi:transcriptional regulator with XRE-family HTH domain